MGFYFFCCRRKKQVAPESAPITEKELELEPVPAQNPEPIRLELKEPQGFFSRLHPDYLSYLEIYQGKKHLTVLNQMRIDNHILYHLTQKNLHRAERHYYQMFGQAAPNFRKKLEHASLLASIAKNYSDLRTFLLLGLMKEPLTIMQMMLIDHHILPASKLGDLRQASRHYHALFGQDALPFEDLWQIFSPSSPKFGT